MTVFQKENPILAVTKTASGTITKRRFVGYNGAQCATKGMRALGVATDGAADGQSVAINVAGTSLVVAGEALNQNVEVTTSGEGKAVIAGYGEYVNGVTMEQQLVPGQLVEIMLGGNKVTTVPTTTTTTTTTTSSTSSTTTTTAP